MKELKKLVTDLSNIDQLIVNASIDLDGLAEHYDNNTWLKDQLSELGNDLDKVIIRLGNLRNIYNFKGGE